MKQKISNPMMELALRCIGKSKGELIQKQEVNQNARIKTR